MKIIAYFIIATTAICAIRSIHSFFQRQHWDKEHVVYLPFSLAVIGIVCAGLFCIPTFLLASDGDGLCLFFAAFTLLGDSLMIAQVNCVIFYNDQSFCVRNFFGIRRESGFGSVEGTRGGRDRRIFMQGTSFLLDSDSIGSYEFFLALEKGYRRATGKHLPTIPRRFDPMNGHVDHPWFYFFLWIAMALMCLAMVVFPIISINKQIDPSKVTPHITAFSHYEIDDGDLLLFTSDGKTKFTLSRYRDYGDAIPTPEVFVSGEIYQIGTTGTNNYIRSLADLEGKTYITFELERQIYRDSQQGAVIFLSVFGIVGAVFSYFGIAVARHPHKYSKKFRQLFYKDGVLHNN